ncbi:NADH dehydrogenase [Nostocales cyanobacterium HT-58-2]|nr:NADH dehydrogenase [Nostocales cyanobacterium HT-58-2]
MNDLTNPNIIIGAGFTGLFTTLHLRHQRCSVPTILIDKEERFIFKPLLYEFLSGEMNASQVWPRYNDLLQNSGVTFIQDTIQGIDLHQRKVCLTSGLHYSYSHLVLTLGSTTGYFDVTGAQENSFPFRTGKEAVALAKYLQERLQLASQTKDSKERSTLLTVAIVGGGPSGVELAATLADLLPIWYTKLGGNFQEIRVVLIHRGKEILQGDINTRLRSTAQNALKNRTVSVELLLESEVTAIHANQLEFKHHNQPEVLSSATIVWTVGTTTNPLIKALPVPPENRDKHGRLKITSTLQLPDFPEVFAGGDCAVDVENPLPATAQVAYQQGAMIAHNLKAISEGRSLSPAHVSLRGTLLKLGLAESAAEIFNRFEVKGNLGHLIRVAAYLELLPTPVHDFKVTTEWLTDEVFHLTKSVAKTS